MSFLSIPFAASFSIKGVNTSGSGLCTLVSSAPCKAKNLSSGRRKHSSEPPACVSCNGPPYYQHEFGEDPWPEEVVECHTMPHIYWYLCGRCHAYSLSRGLSLTWMTWNGKPPDCMGWGKVSSPGKHPRYITCTQFTTTFVDAKKTG